MSGEPMSWKVRLNVFRGGLLKTTKEAALIICKTQREEDLNSSQTVRKNHRCIMPAVEPALLPLPAPAPQWPGAGLAS